MTGWSPQFCSAERWDFVEWVIQKNRTARSGPALEPIIVLLCQRSHMGFVHLTNMLNINGPISTREPGSEWFRYE